MKENKFMVGQSVNFWRGDHRKPLTGSVVRAGNANAGVHFPSLGKTFVLGAHELEIVEEK